MDRQEQFQKKFEKAARLLGCERRKQDLVSIKFRDNLSSEDYRTLVEYLGTHPEVNVRDTNDEDGRAIRGRGWIVSVQAEHPVLLVEHESGLELILQHIGQIADIMTTVGFITGMGLPQIITGIWKRLRAGRISRVEVRKLADDGKVVEMPLPMTDRRMFGRRFDHFDHDDHLIRELLSSQMALEQRVFEIEKTM